MWIQMPYGRDAVEVELPSQAEVVHLPEWPAVPDTRSEVRRAMDQPIGSPSLREVARGRPDAVVVINDITRPTPTALLLDEILADLAAVGIDEQQVTAIIACGTHRPNTPAEVAEMVGPAWASRFHIVNHDASDPNALTLVGHTETGVPVWVNALLARPSLKVLTGVIAPHHGAGYSGGRKSILPGVAGLETIKRLHSFPVQPYEPAMGWVEGNPFHREALEGARMVGVDFIVNLIQNAQGEVVRAVAGDLENAHQAGVAVCEKQWRVSFSHKYDVVVASPGGYPRDIDLHQAQKAMSTAELLAREGGTIVLIAECADGIGAFGAWLKESQSPSQVIGRFARQGFAGSASFKAFYCARALERHPVIVACTGITRQDLESMFFRYAPSAQAAVDQALRLAGPKARVLAIPHAVDCLPSIANPWESVH